MPSSRERRTAAVSEVWTPFASLPELTLVGHGITHRASRLPTHTHPGQMTLLYLVSGLVWLRIAHDELRVHGGQVLSVLPGEAKAGGDDVLAPCELYWILVRLTPKTPRRFLGLDSTRAAVLHEALWRLPCRAQSVPALLPPLVSDLWVSVHAKDALAPIAGRAALLRLLVAITQAKEGDNAARAHSPLILKAAELLQSAVAEPVTMPRIARQIGLSAPHFQRLFKAEMGVSPGRFAMRQRIAQARRLLRETRKSVVEIAMECGFSSSQYFSVCFRRQYAQTPSAYRTRAKQDDGQSPSGTRMGRGR